MNIFYIYYYTSKSTKSVKESYPSVSFKLNSTDSYKSHYKIQNIIALVFYGRKKSASILFRYLDRNLKINGGILDKIVIAVRTNKEQDLSYLESYLKANKNSKCCYETEHFPANVSYKILYKGLHDDDLVFKIDDDVVFISNGTFEKMLDEYLTKNHFILSANVVNHPQLSYAHARLRAILPFYEVKQFVWEKSANSSEEIDGTIAMGADYGPMSEWWRNPRCAAIAHESLLYHASNNNLNVYDFRIWDFNTVEYHRWSINFIVMWGRYLNKLYLSYPDMKSDEVTLTVLIPKQMKKHSIALGSALVAHFSYWSQYFYLNKTDILNKYERLSIDYLKLPSNN